MSAPEEKIDNIVQHNEKDLSQSGDSGEEKGIQPKNVYPMNDEDYIVTFKTWIVVTILASAYGVSPIALLSHILPNLTGLFLDRSGNWCHLSTSIRTT